MQEYRVRMVMANAYVILANNQPISPGVRSRLTSPYHIMSEVVRLSAPQNMSIVNFGCVRQMLHASNLIVVIENFIC
jgi:hypothetical protein